MIDDATSRITALHFFKSEGLEAYYGVLEKHVLTYGIPLALYGDHCGALHKPKTESCGGKESLVSLCVLLLGFED